MEKTLSVLTLSIVSMVAAAAPVSAFAYLSPDQVFGGSSLTLKQAAPDQQSEQVTKRSAEDVVTQQYQQAASSRAAAQSELPSTEAAPADTYVPSQQASSLGLFDQNVQYQKRQELIQSQKSTGPTIIIGGNGDVIDVNGNVLHSGAPRVTSTGPETMLAVAAMVLAAMCTLGYAQVRSRVETTIAA